MKLAIKSTPLLICFSLVNQFSSVTILALEMPEPKLKVVIGYLACFPCLEKFYVKVLFLTCAFLGFCCHIY